MQYFLVLIFIGLTFAADLEIFRNEVTNEIEEHAIAKTLLAMEALKTDQLVATNLTNEMNIKFGKSWMCFIGLNFNSAAVAFEHQANSLLWFAYKQKHILLFKPMTETTICGNEYNFTEMINKARLSQPTLVENNNQTTYTKVLNITHQALAVNYPHCQIHNKSERVEQWCFRDISMKIVQDVKRQLPGNWSVSVGKSNQYFSVLDKIKTEILFALSDLFFEIIELS